MAEIATFQDPDYHDESECCVFQISTGAVGALDDIPEFSRVGVPGCDPYCVGPRAYALPAVVEGICDEDALPDIRLPGLSDEAWDELVEEAIAGAADAHAWTPPQEMTTWQKIVRSIRRMTWPLIRQFC